MDQVTLEKLLAPYSNMLTVEELAAILRVHPRSVQRWAREGRLTAVSAGRSYRFPRENVLRWMLNSSTTLDTSTLSPSIELAILDHPDG
jgi:excisionase family DNA binding protein